MTGGPAAQLRASWLAALTDACLADLTYPAVLARGREILSSGAIQRPELTFPAPDEAALLATIVGTEPYQVGVMLSGASRVTLEASCTCPHAQDGHFCKHQVALALRLRADLGGEVVAVNALTAGRHAATLKRAAEEEARTSALREFLAGQPSAVLADRLMLLVDEAPELRRELLAWQAAADATGNARATAELVAELLTPEEFLDWRGSCAYARVAARVVPVLEGALQTQPPAQALQLVECAYRCLQLQLHDADDSDGEIGEVCAAVGDLWLRALRSAGPQPAAFGERYGALRDGEVFEAIPHADALAAMGPKAARRYGERLRDAFEAALAGGRELWAERSRYLHHLRDSGDDSERLRVLRARLQTEADHVALIEELQSQGHARDALDAARRAHQQFPEGNRVEELLLAILASEGNDAEALALHQARFDREPSADRALAVLQAAARAQVAPEPLREQMWRALIAAEQNALLRWKPGYGVRAQPRPAGPDVSARLRWLMHEGRMEAAVDLAQPPNGAVPHLLRELALALPRRRDADAAALLQRCFMLQMPFASSPYTDALRLATLIAERLPNTARADWLAGLRQTYRAKRNFIKGLP